MNLKYAFLGLSKRRFFSIITILQLTIALLIFNQSFSIKSDIASNLSKVSKITRNSHIYKLNDDSDTEKLFTSTFAEVDVNNRIDSFYKYLTTSKDFTFVSANEGNLSVEPFKNINNFFISSDNNYSVTNDNVKYENLHNLSVSENFFSTFDFNLSSGRLLISEDFKPNKKVLPTILGYNYVNIFKLGDKIKYYNPYENSINELEVVGFLDKDFYFLDSNFSINNLIHLNDYIILPNNGMHLPENSKRDNKKVNSTYHSNAYNTIFSSYIIPRNGLTDLNGIVEKAKITKVFDVRLISGQVMIDYFKNNIGKTAQYADILFIILIVFIIISIIVSTLSSIEKRYNEFAVHLLTGSSMKDIILRIFLEISILIMISYVISVAIIIRYFTANYYNFIVLALVCIGITFIISIFPLLKLKNTSINYMLRRKE
jgi:putative ABC transport system permease protein